MKTIVRRFSTLIALAVLVILPASATVKKTSLHEETPRMKCLKRVQKEHLECLAAAKGDEKKKSACTKALNESLKTCPKN